MLPRVALDQKRLLLQSTAARLISEELWLELVLIGRLLFGTWPGGCLNTFCGLSYSFPEHFHLPSRVHFPPFVISNSVFTLQLNKLKGGLGECLMGKMLNFEAKKLIETNSF
jgi:hypothetical protein